MGEGWAMHVSDVKGGGAEEERVNGDGVDKSNGLTATKHQSVRVCVWPCGALLALAGFWNMRCVALRLRVRVCGGDEAGSSHTARKTEPSRHGDSFPSPPPPPPLLPRPPYKSPTPASLSPNLITCCSEHTPPRSQIVLLLR
jgi:hypothetical protein